MNNDNQNLHDQSLKMRKVKKNSLRFEPTIFQLGDRHFATELPYPTTNLIIFLNI